MDNQPTNQPDDKPSAPPVPRGLMSARPAMTKIVPRRPDKVAEASQAMADAPDVPPVPTEQEIAERQERIDYLKNIRDTRQQGNDSGKKWVVVLVIAILVAVLAGLGFAYWQINKQPAPKAKQSSSQTSQNTQAQTQAPTQQTDQTQYKPLSSSNFGLSLKYPSDWMPSDTPNELTIISPVEQLPGSAGAPVSGAVVLAIRPQQQSLAEFKTGNGVAVLDSRNVAYTAPASGQRGNTYLSYVQYNNTITKGALDSIYITGNSGYKKDQTIPMADIVKVNPLINVYFVQCTASCAPTGTAMNVNAATWVSGQLNGQVETMLKSLAIN